MRAILGMVLVLAASAVFGQQQSSVRATVAQLKAERSAGGGRLVSQAHAAGQALLHANGHLELRKQPKLYCQPARLSLNGLNYAEITLTEFERTEAFYASEPTLQKYAEEALTMMLVEGLIRTFPCK